MIDDDELGSMLFQVPMSTGRAFTLRSEITLCVGLLPVLHWHSAPSDRGNPHPNSTTTNHGDLL